MNEWIDTVGGYVHQHQTVAYTTAGLLTLTLLGVVGVQVWAAYRGRSLTTRASLLFTVVQCGVAYVTVTGLFEFWAHKVQVPAVEAALIAGFIEAVTWSAVAMIFAHGGVPGSTGVGDAGPLFWLSVTGGGIMAIAGSPTLAVAVGRTVVVVLGALMWNLRIRQRTRRNTQASKWTITPHDLLLRLGWIIPSDEDVKHSSREWQVRTLTRAVGRYADGRGVSKWLGGRAIRRVMEAGDAAMVKDAQARYARQHVLRTEIDPKSASMAAAIDAARRELAPAPQPEPQATAPDPTPEPEPEVVPDRPKPRPAARRVVAAKNRGTSSETKAQAENVALELLAAGAALPTSKELGARFGLGEEWGRTRLVEARKRFMENGHATPVG